MNLLHIIPALGPGGPTRALLTVVKETRRTHPEVRHRVVALQPGEYMPLLFQLRREGVEIMRSAGVEQVAARIERSDVVLIHLWNTPELWRLLTSDLPPARYIIWTNVLGAHTPQRLNRVLLSRAAALATTAPLPEDLAAALPDAVVLTAPADPRRLEGLVRHPHQGFNVDYIGTTNQGKMHPRFIDMLARLDIPQLTVRICGGALEPAMNEAVEASGDPDRFERRGFVEDIRTILATTDVFAYPLAEQSYATSDLSLQEAMLAGVPPVIFPHGGPSRFVTNGLNGIIASNEDEFVAAIEYLWREPDERAALGRAAARTAQQLFRPEKPVSDLMVLVDRASRASARPMWPSRASDGATAASVLFLISQDWPEIEAQAAFDAWMAGRSEELLRFADGLDDAAFQVEGGILHWRKHAMGDPLIRTWTAGWLMRHGRIAEARLERDEALKLGAPVPAASDQAMC